MTGEQARPTAGTLRVLQRSDWDGVVVRVKRRGEEAVVDLLDFQSKWHPGVKVTLILARELARRLHEPVRLIGDATWWRDDAGWHLESFVADSFVPLRRTRHAELLARLAGLGRGLPDDVIDRILADRDPDPQ